MSKLPRGFRRQLLRASITTVTGTLLAAKVFNPVVATASTVVVAAHEFGHWTSAWFHDADPVVPAVIPMGVFTIGITKVRKLMTVSTRTRRRVIAAGPRTGLATVLCLIPLAVVIPVWRGAVVATGIYELYNALFGSDGKRFRHVTS